MDILRSMCIVCSYVLEDTTSFLQELAERLVVFVSKDAINRATY